MALPLNVIRGRTHRHLRQARQRAPPALKERIRRQRPVRDPPPLRTANLSFFITKPYLHHSPASFSIIGILLSRRPENWNAECVASRPGKGETNYWRFEAVTDRENRGLLELRRDRDKRAVAGIWSAARVLGERSNNGHFSGKYKQRDQGLGLWEGLPNGNYRGKYEMATRPRKREGSVGVCFFHVFFLFTLCFLMDGRRKNKNREKSCHFSIKKLLIFNFFFFGNYN